MQALTVVGEAFFLHIFAKFLILFVRQVEFLGFSDGGVFDAIFHAVVKQLFALRKVVDDARQAVRFDNNVRRDATSVAHNSSGSGEKLFGEGVRFVDGHAVLEVVGLYAASGGNVVFRPRHLQCAVVGHLAALLHEPFAIGSFAQDDGSVIVLQCAAGDFSR